MKKKKQPIAPSPSRKQGRLRHILSVLFHVEKLPFYFILSFLLLTVIECLARRSLIEGLLFPFRNPLPWLANYGIILMTTQLALLFRKRIAVLSLISAIWLGLGIAECVLLSFRITPLTAVDFSILTSVITIIGIYLKPLQIVLLSLLIAGALTVIVLLFIKVPKVKRSFKKFTLSILSSAAAFSLIVILGFQINALSNDFPNLTDAYRDYGFAYCFSLSIFDKGIEKPKNYSEAAVNTVLGEIEAGLTEEEPDTPNVIFVQLESFFDVNLLKDVTFSENPLPNFTRLKEKGQSGPFRVPVVGAGTVNTEFEVLTGLSVNDFGPGEYPYKSILRHKTVETIAYDLAASGYTAHALHNHQGTFYERHEVYQNLGFSSFTSLEYMKDPTYNPTQWAKDEVLTGEILSVLKGSDTRDFVFAVSVQGHGKYPTDYTPEEDDLRVTGGIEEEELLSQYNYYIRQLQDTDAFIGELYEAVMAYEEPTILVFYGDHLPSLSLLEEQLATGNLYETEYLILSNYDLPWQEEPEELSSYQLFPTVMALMHNREGVINRYHQTAREKDDYRENLQLLAYDILYGENYTYNGKDVFEKREDMTLGTRPITVTDVWAKEGWLYIQGENFTAYSVVLLDSSKEKTIYVDENTLMVKLSVFNNRFTEVKVRQKTTLGEFLSESNTLILSEFENGVEFTTSLADPPTDSNS